MLPALELNRLSRAGCWRCDERSDWTALARVGASDRACTLAELFWLSREIFWARSVWLALERLWA
jgi:hypothetical protein